MPPYVQQVWTDSTTPVDSAHMTHIEAGLGVADANASAALARVQVPAVVNGQWVKGVGGAAVWAAITPADIAGYPADNTKFLRGDGAWAVVPPSQKVTTSTLAGGPPASPADQDIWIATAVDANGTRWMFQYNAGSASAYKWEFIGGPPLGSSVAPSEATTSAVFADLATVGPSITLARGGDYRFDMGITAIATAVGGGNAQAQLLKNGTTQIGQVVYANMVNLAGAAFSIWNAQGVGGVAAGDAYRMRYSISNSVNTSFAERWLAVTPIRVS